MHRVYNFNFSQVKKKVLVKKRMFLQDHTISFIGCVDVPTSCAFENKAEKKHYTII